MEIFWFLLSSLAGGMGALACFFYHMKMGRFEEIEEVKYQMFHEEDD